MNIKKLLFLLCAAMGLMAQHANAVNRWSGPKQVISVQVVEHGGFLVTFDSIVASGCSTGGSNTLYVYSGNKGVTQEGQKALLSLALTSMSTGMKLDLMYDDDSANCWAIYGRLSRS